jgi:hypothetical protein
VYNDDNGVTKAFRNLPGVDLCHVDRLNLLQLAPGGHMGRFIIWTKSAFGRLDQIFGSVTRPSVQKTGYTLPRAPMIQSDLTRLINSDEIQSKVRASIKSVRRGVHQKKNPKKNLGALITLNPYALTLRRAELLAQERRAVARSSLVDARRKGQTVAKSAEEKAKIAANKKHGANKAKNYARITAGGQGSRLWQPPVKIDKKVLEAKAAEKADQDKKAAEEAAKKAPKPVQVVKPVAVPVTAKPPTAKPAKGDDKKGKEEKPAKGGEEKKGKEEKPAKGDDKKGKDDKGGKAEKPAKGDKGGKGK